MVLRPEWGGPLVGSRVEWGVPKFAEPRESLRRLRRAVGESGAPA